jgi:carbamoyltransferase
MNKRIRELDEVEETFIQPVSSDAGLTLGAVLEHSRRNGNDVRYKMTNTYLGPEFSDDEVRDVIDKTKVESKDVANPIEYAANKIAEGNLVGWFQGRLEMGPRALGHRSILADPRQAESKDRVNFYVKHRENWRPFAPSILEEYGEKYLENYTESPFMIDTFAPTEGSKDEIPAVLHPADKTTRPQTVTEQDSPRYYRLIDKFREQTGVPLVLNTSFNDSGEPIVNTPRDALKDFYGMGLDMLVIEDTVIEKTHN